MIVKRIVLGLVAAFAAAAAAGVTVVAAAFALYAVLRDALTPAGAAAVVAAVFALLIGLCAMFAALMARPPHRKAEESGVTGKALDLAREKPWIAAAVAAGAGLLLLRNPKLITTALTAFLAGKAAPKR